MEKERESSERVAWGTGRVAFRANLPTIEKLLDDGWPMTAVYQRVKDSLAGLSYNQFTYHVRQQFPSGHKRRETKQNASKPSLQTDEAISVTETAMEGLAHDEKPKAAAGKPSKFQPGPKLPDPSKLY